MLIPDGLHLPAFFLLELNVRLPLTQNFTTELSMVTLKSTCTGIPQINK